jgi:ribosomal-protein-alanine N-acetyltransferase
VSTPFELRRMEVRDLAEVMSIERLSFSNPWSETTFEGELQNRSVSVPMVAVEAAEKKVIGYVIYWKIGNEVQINNIAVDPGHRRRGVAEGMLDRILGSVRKEGAAFVALEVRVSNSAARTLYEKFGFEVIGLRKNYYSRPDEDAVVMGLYL